MSDLDAEIALLERATAGIRIVTCEICDEHGHVRGVPVPVLCPRCNGTKHTTELADEQ